MDYETAKGLMVRSRLEGEVRLFMAWVIMAMMFVMTLAFFAVLR